MGENWIVLAKSLGVLALLESMSRSPTECNVPSAMSIPALVVSPTASAVVLINEPVVYPKIDNICNINGFIMLTPDSKTYPTEESRFIPKRENINKTNRIIISAFWILKTWKIFDESDAVSDDPFCDGAFC